MNIAFNVSDLLGILPVLIVIAFAALCALAEVFAKPGQSRGFVGTLGLIGALIAFAANAWQWHGLDGAYSVPLFGGGLVMDAFSTYFNFLFLAGTALTLVLSTKYLKEHGSDLGEFHALVLFAAAGMMLMAQSRDLIILFIALELMSVSIYVLVAFVRKSRRGAEAALKYFLIGAFASAILLYGIALLYGATNSVELTTIRRALDADPSLANGLLVRLGMVLVLVGIGFKVALAPFHLWTPDVYDGAPSPVTGFMASCVKAAGFAVLIRVFTVTFGYDAMEFGAGGNGWVGVLYLLAIVTMFAGNLAALPQSNVKRILAYSSIAHAGYLLVGVVAGSFGNLTIDTEAAATLGPNGAILFYLMVYAFSTFLVFSALSLFGKDGEEHTHLSDIAGMGFRRPFVGLALAVGMLSLAGMPPLGGFFGKFYLFREAMLSGRPEVTILVLVAIVNSMIGLYYYLRVLVFLYMKEPTREVPVYSSRGATTVGLISLALVFLLGLFPGGLLTMAQRGIGSLRPVVTTPTASLTATEPQTPPAASRQAGSRAPRLELKAPPAQLKLATPINLKATTTH